MKELLVWCGWCGCVMKLKKGSSHFLDNLSDCLIRAPEKILGGKKKNSGAHETIVEIAQQVRGSFLQFSSHKVIGFSCKKKQKSHRFNHLLTRLSSKMASDPREEFHLSPFVYLF